MQKVCLDTQVVLRNCPELEPYAVKVIEAENPFIKNLSQKKLLQDTSHSLKAEMQGILSNFDCWTKSTVVYKKV